MRRIAAALLALAVLAPAPAALAQSRPLSVEVDHVARLNLNGSAASVIIGNPQIADVTVVDAQTLFVSGRAYGVTEIVVLDAAGRSIYQGEVVVSSPSRHEVTFPLPRGEGHYAVGHWRNVAIISSRLS